MTPNQFITATLKRRSSGFSLLETPIVIAINSAMASAAYLVSTNVQKDTENSLVGVIRHEAAGK